VPESRLYNDGNLSLGSEWFFEWGRLPPIGGASKLKLSAIFDFGSGGVGFDNIKFSTQQK
jgi:hypothetical protein